MREFPLLISAGAIRRFHTIHVNRVQTVGEHTWAVMMILTQIKAPISINLMQAALVHDLAEIVTGDIPAPVKWGNLDLEDALCGIEEEFHEATLTTVPLNPEERRLLRWADSMELMIYAHSELRSGNGHMLEVFDRIKAHVRQMEFPNDAARQLYEEYQYV